MQCHVCKANGESDEASVHSPSDINACKYHPRHVKELRKKPRKGTGLDDSEPSLDADLRDTFTPSRKTRASSGGTPAPDPVPMDRLDKMAKDDTISISALVKAMYAGEMSQRVVLEVLGLRLLETEVDKEERAINKALILARDWTPPDADDSDGDHVGEEAKELQDLQSRHGKLVGTLMGCHKHTVRRLHLNYAKEQGSREVLQDADSGKQYVKVSSREDVSSWAVLWRVLIDFRYICVQYNWLTMGESLHLEAFVWERFYLEQSCVIAWRTMRRLLSLIDNDVEKRLEEVIATNAERLMSQEADFASKAAGKDVRSGTHQDPDPPSSSKVKISLKPGDRKLAVKYASAKICWCWTNGVPCEDLTATGECRWASKHGVCGKTIQDPANPGSNKKCTGSHRAVDCPN